MFRVLITAAITSRDFGLELCVWFLSYFFVFALFVGSSLCLVR